MPAAQKSSSAYKIQELAYDIPEHEEKRRISRKRKAKNEMGGREKFKTICTVLVCFGVAFYIILRYAAITEANSKVESMKKQLTKLESANQQTQVELDRSIDLKKVEEVAENKLGMQRPEKFQTVYVNLQSNDYAEVAKQPEKVKKQGIFGMMMKRITNVLEYLY